MLPSCVMPGMAVERQQPGLTAEREMAIEVACTDDVLSGSSSAGNPEAQNPEP